MNSTKYLPGIVAAVNAGYNDVHAEIEAEGSEEVLGGESA